MCLFLTCIYFPCQLKEGIIKIEISNDNEVFKGDAAGDAKLVYMKIFLRSLFIQERKSI